MMTIAEQIKVTEFLFRIKDSKGNLIYFETSYKYWIKREYDSNNNVIYYEDSDKYRRKSEFDLNKWEIYYENSEGLIVDNRPKSIPEYTMEELTKMLGKEFKIKK